MAIDFKVKDVMHKIVVKFIHAFLPEAKKPYNLKTVHQQVLGIHEIASKADTYNMTVSPKVIEEGMTAGMELIYYLLADGYRIKLPICNLGLRIPGEYDGSETRLPDGVFPSVLFFSFDVIRCCVTRCYTTSYATFHLFICKKQDTSAFAGKRRLPRLPQRAYRPCL